MSDSLLCNDSLNHMEQVPITSLICFDITLCT